MSALLFFESRYNATRPGGTDAQIYRGLVGHGAARADGWHAAPKMTADDVTAGAKTFRSHCAECHGLNGEGGRGPNLSDGVFYTDHPIWIC